MSQPRLLLVDDEPEILEFLEIVFEDYAVEKAETAPAALERLRAGAFDVLITDIKMPGGSGLDLVRHAREIAPRMKVIVMTGHHQGGGNGDDDGIFRWIHKPFKGDLILGIVREALGEASASK